ncbi:MAG: hypothetical protein FVQ85_02595 [Planctomycetes bacterium]|nr:hypothetical protein [Planctomycetota bacterium]
MKLKNISKYIAPSSKVVMTIVIFLFVVYILQVITIELSDEISRMLVKTKRNLSTAESTKQFSKAEKRLRRIYRSGKNFLPDGTIHLTYRRGRTSGRFDEPEKIQIYDVNDVLIWQGLENENPYEYLSWSDQRFRPHTSYHRHFTRLEMNNIQMITPEFSRVIEIPIRAQDGTIQVWRYLPGSDLFMGYRLDRSKIGFLGSAGLTLSKTEAKPFGRFKFNSSWYPAGASEPTVLWQTRRHLYQINFHKKQVKLLFESPKANIQAVVLREYQPSDAQMPKAQKIKYRPTIRLMTEDKKQHLIMRKPEQKLTITFPDDRWSSAMNFTATEEGMFLIHQDSEIRMPEAYLKSHKSYLQWISKFEGKPYKRWVELYKVDNQANLHLLNRYEWIVSGEFLPKVQRTNFRLKVQRAAMAFSAPLYDLVCFLLGSEFFIQRYRMGNDFVSGLMRTIVEIRPSNSIFNWVLGIAMVGFAFWHGWPRQTSRAKLIFWLAFTLIFNLAGLLTYLALNHTHIIKCPSCGKSRGLGQVNCLRCGTELPAPQQGKLDLILNT